MSRTTYAKTALALFMMIGFLWALPVGANEGPQKLMEPSHEVKAMISFRLGEKIVLWPEETAEGPDGLVIKHLWYGHKSLPDGPDESFFEMKVTQGAESTTLRIGTPIQEPQMTEWRDWVFHFITCNDNGPPHSKSEPVELMITHR
ncbi:MAG: hypothetical protein PHD48_10320 [Alphaproteobacteria bacterium]|nr:hypothetical protein [Alphaproteobacteria bacterium]